MPHKTKKKRGMQQQIRKIRLPLPWIPIERILIRWSRTYIIKKHSQISLQGQLANLISNIGKASLIKETWEQMRLSHHQVENTIPLVYQLQKTNI
jgi:hypothetical protein